MKMLVKYFWVAAAMVSLAATRHKPVDPMGHIGVWIDMTHDFGPNTVHYPKFQDFRLIVDEAGGEQNFWVESTVCSAERFGTHIDAPKQFAKDGWTVSRIPLSHLVAPGVKIDLSKEAYENANYSLTQERIIEWEQQHGRIPLNSIVFMFFNWERFWPCTSDMFKTNDLSNASPYVFPGLHPDAAEWLVKERSIVAVGTDAPSIDTAQERPHLRSHVTLYENSVYGLEFVANLSRLPETHFDVFVGPVKFENGTGGPVRIAAFVLKSNVAMDVQKHHSEHKDRIVASYASKKVADWVDLTYDINPRIPKWPSVSALSYAKVDTRNTPAGAYFETRDFCMGEHIGTHLDAPRHVNKTAQPVDEIPLERLMGIPGVKIDLKEKARGDANAVLSIEDLQHWEKRNGRIPRGSVVFVESGWGDKWSSAEDYLGTKVPEDSNTFNFPGFGDKAVEWLIHERRVVGFGIDTVSLDNGASQDFLAHLAILRNQFYGLENVANLNQIPQKDFTVFIMPYKIRGGSGGPTRVFVLKEAATKAFAVESDAKHDRKGKSSGKNQQIKAMPVDGSLASVAATDCLCVY